MDNSVLISLVAVFLGWTLNELAGAFRIAREERQLVRSSIPALSQLYFEQYRINQILTFFNKKMGDDFETFYKAINSGDIKHESALAFISNYLSRHEESRRINISLPDINRSALLEAVKEAASALAKVDPVSAYEAKKLLSEFILFQESELPAASDNPQLYLQQWEMMLSVYRGDLSSLRNLILKTSCRASIFDYIQVRRLLKSEEAGLYKGSGIAFDRMASYESGPQKPSDEQAA
ncbi:MAG: hypothetical protein ACOY4U_11230 [Pseudomonadota bacterium]